MENEKGEKIKAKKIDHEREFYYFRMDEYYINNEIHHYFTTPRTPQQNGVIRKKNLNSDGSRKDIVS